MLDVLFGESCLMIVGKMKHIIKNMKNSVKNIGEFRKCNAKPKMDSRPASNIELVKQMQRMLGHTVRFCAKLVCDKTESGRPSADRSTSSEVAVLACATTYQQYILWPLKVHRRVGVDYGQSLMGQ
eukprot:gb/GECG01005190.1/.p1 GENE.gb/GECG01005190.1/~~gb/GECG01005190.1/.p1  ORF type:complete len:126 (+),score=7.44 gb/GECG01005190.1/:1-378(+)